MPSDPIAQALLDIVTNIRLATEFLGDTPLAAFASDRRSVYAVERCLEIISEASRRLPPEFRRQRPEQPWHDILAAGNFYRHEYDEIDEELVWKTVRHALPSLLVFAERELLQRGVTP